jgi:hypothetical protein
MGDLRPGLLHANHRRRFDVRSIAHVRHMQDRYGHMLLWPRNARAGRARLFGRASIRWGASAPAEAGDGNGARGAAGWRAAPHDTPVLALHPQGDGWRLDTARGPLRAGPCWRPPAAMGRG